VIDVSRAELVRVRDIVLAGQGADWQVVAVVPAPVTTFPGWLRRLWRTEEPAEEVPWTNVEPLFGHVPTAARSLLLPRLSRLRPADIADIVEQASHEMYGLTPKCASARSTPMNSVTSVRKLRRKRSPTEKMPQKRPNRSKIILPCPTPVTAPRRTTISWLTIRTGISSSRTQSKLVP
jgi:hypothetical protein